MKNLLKNGFKTASVTIAAGILPATANAADTLAKDDFVGISFWVISMALVAATAFFFIETTRVEGKWKTSLTVSGMVTLVAAVHYFYMRDVWIATGETPTVYRYIDWLITVPLLMVEFYLILRAITNVSQGIFWRLMIGTLVMLIGGYAGEAGYIGTTFGFVIGMLGWAYILYEVFAGEASKVVASEASASVQSAFSTMRWIVTIGWAIYPIGYFMGYMNGAVSDESLNIIYNVADVWNKIAFGVIIWNVAVTESESK
ncbi:MAG: bacteriorhodopsin-like [Emcibacteraceae bacterium]|jgi:sensory rhodopsin|nr:bacteriorhodopsin-like [Emcibacteraceae bacterium]MDG1726938.1 bacteriorhodopsin-like [Emcibacteraceae bacterium]